jgi:hypothetical protein
MNEKIFVENNKNDKRLSQSYFDDLSEFIIQRSPSLFKDGEYDWN